MRLHRVLWMVWAFAGAAFATPTGGNTENDASQPSDLPENWDQAKDDTQSLFLNKNNKNDLEPYPMALSEDVTNARFDAGTALRGDYDSAKAKSGNLDSIVMRPELYGEPPAMNQYDRLYNDVERRKRGVVKMPKRSGMVRRRRSKPTTVANRPKRESGMSSADVLTLLSLWEAQQRRNQERQYPSSYYTPDNYYSVDSDDQGYNVEDLGDERWMDEPVVPAARESNHYYEMDPYTAYYPKESRYYQADPSYFRSDEAARRKKQWVGFRNANRVSKRFMVSKKRADPVQAYQKNYRPRDDLYSLVELLKSSPDQEQDLPVYRRSIL